MTTTEGLTSKELKKFNEFLIKANYLQLEIMESVIENEIAKRDQIPAPEVI